MTDPFHLLGPEFDAPREFGDAYHAAVARLEAASMRFDALSEQLPESSYDDEEWTIVERAARDLEEAVERAEEGFVAVQYDSHAWYRIMETLTVAASRLESAIGIMERVRARGAPGDSLV